MSELTLTPPPGVDAGAFAGEVTSRLLSGGFDRWSTQAASCGHCAHPVRLRGSATTLDKATGEVLSTYDTTTEPDGVAYVRCGNRRASVCPSCSHEYKGDMWHLLAAGAAGGMKGVPNTIGTHPLVFATLTAPSFGPVHTTGRGGLCRPRSGRSKTLCAHGKPTWCAHRHHPDDTRLGQPLCPDCYDYTGHVVWQWHAPELWRRFTITLRRLLAARLGVTVTALQRLVRISFAKVAEFQRRAVVHFHALIRLDGPPTTPDTTASTDTAHEEPSWSPPLVPVPAELLADLVHQAAARVRFDASPTRPGDHTRRLGFGAQVDARPVNGAADREASRADEGRPLHPETVAAYIAKYATKACEDFGLPPRVRSGEIARHLGVREHVCRLLDEVNAVTAGGHEDYVLAGKWAAMLGFRGHFATKSRRYSTTLGKLRTARRRWTLNQIRANRARDTTGPLQDVTHDHDTDEQDTTLVVSTWSLDGFGWLTTGDAALAAAAAAAAREHADTRARNRAPQHNRPTA